MLFLGLLVAAILTINIACTDTNLASSISSASSRSTSSSESFSVSFLHSRHSLTPSTSFLSTPSHHASKTTLTHHKPTHSSHQTNSTVTVGPSVDSVRSHSIATITPSGRQNGTSRITLYSTGPSGPTSHVSLSFSASSGIGSGSFSDPGAPFQNSTTGYTGLSTGFFPTTASNSLSSRASVVTFFSSNSSAKTSFRASSYLSGPVRSFTRSTLDPSRVPTGTLTAPTGAGKPSISAPFGNGSDPGVSCASSGSSVLVSSLSHTIRSTGSFGSTLTAAPGANLTATRVSRLSSGSIRTTSISSFKDPISTTRVSGSGSLSASGSLVVSSNNSSSISGYTHQTGSGLPSGPASEHTSGALGTSTESSNSAATTAREPWKTHPNNHHQPAPSTIKYEWRFDDV